MRFAIIREVCYSMKKGYYIHFDAKRTPGVAKKIDMQIQEFSKHYDMKEVNITSEPVSAMRRVIRLLPFGAIDRSYEQALQIIEEPAFIYVRRATADRFYVNFLRTIKKRWSKCKIIIEIFTYPYDKDEFGRTWTWPYYFKETYQRKKLPGIVDRYVTYSPDTVIFGIPTIRTANGIYVDKIEMPKPKSERKNELNLIGVAFMQKHHGYERILEGMHLYYEGKPERKVICHFVGDGPEKPKYQNIVKKYNLEEYVYFYPTTVSRELDALYENADIALSALGVYKDGINRENSLKTREYMAKGFPMITGCKVDGIEENYPFLCQFSNDSTPIDIERIVKYFDELRQEYKQEEMKGQIRNYVKKIADMPIVMQPIIDYIENQEK